MRIKKEEIKDVAKVLKELNFYPIEGDYTTHYIALPIDNDKKENFNGIELIERDKGSGTEKRPIPCLVLSTSPVNPVVLGYCDISYSRPFNILEYADLIGNKLSKGERKTLEDLDVFIVHRDNLLAQFEIGKHKEIKK